MTPVRLVAYTAKHNFYFPHDFVTVGDRWGRLPYSLIGNASHGQAVSRSCGINLCSSALCIFAIQYIICLSCGSADTFRRRRSLAAHTDDKHHCKDKSSGETRKIGKSHYCVCSLSILLRMRACLLIALSSSLPVTSSRLLSGLSMVSEPLAGS